MEPRRSRRARVDVPDYFAGDQYSGYGSGAKTPSRAPAAQSTSLPAPKKKRTRQSVEESPAPAQKKKRRKAEEVDEDDDDNDDEEFSANSKKVSVKKRKGRSQPTNAGDEHAAEEFVPGSEDEDEEEADLEPEVIQAAIDAASGPPKNPTKHSSLTKQDDDGLLPFGALSRKQWIFFRAKDRRVETFREVDIGNGVKPSKRPLSDAARKTIAWFRGVCVSLVQRRKDQVEDDEAGDVFAVSMKKLLRSRSAEDLVDMLFQCMSDDVQDIMSQGPITLESLSRLPGLTSDQLNTCFIAYFSVIAADGNVRGRYTGSATHMEESC